MLEITTQKKEDRAYPVAKNTKKESMLIILRTKKDQHKKSKISEKSKVTHSPSYAF